MKSREHSKPYPLSAPHETPKNAAKSLKPKHYSRNSSKNKCIHLHRVTIRLDPKIALKLEQELSTLQHLVGKSEYISNSIRRYLQIPLKNAQNEPTTDDLIAHLCQVYLTKKGPLK